MGNTQLTYKILSDRRVKFCTSVECFPSEYGKINAQTQFDMSHYLVRYAQERVKHLSPSIYIYLCVS